MSAARKAARILTLLLMISGVTLFVRAQEARRQAALQARSNAVKEARAKAQTQVQAAKADIESDRAAAEKGLQGEAAALAQEIVRRVLQPAGAGR